MNKDQVKGQAKDIAGKVQAEAGKMVGSTEQHVKGIKLQVEGKAQKKTGRCQSACQGYTPGSSRRSQRQNLILSHP